MGPFTPQPVCIPDMRLSMIPPTVTGVARQWSDETVSSPFPFPRVVSQQTTMSPCKPLLHIDQHRYIVSTWKPGINSIMQRQRECTSSLRSPFYYFGSTCFQSLFKLNISSGRCHSFWDNPQFFSNLSTSLVLITPEIQNSCY